MKTYLIKEIFGPTIQGEGEGAGDVVLFLRFAGCNKWSGKPEHKASSACPFCDTDFINGTKMTKQEILDELLSLDNARSIKTLVLTGGEPTLQIDVELLELLSQYWYLYLETNGSKILDQEIMDYIDHVCCSPKQSPDNTLIDRIDSLKILNPPIDESRSVLNFLNDRLFLIKKGNPTIFVQPVEDLNYSKNLQDTIDLALQNPRLKISLQLHKILNVK